MELSFVSFVGVCSAGLYAGLALLAGAVGGILGESFGRPLLIHVDTRVAPPAFAILTTAVVPVRLVNGGV